MINIIARSQLMDKKLMIFLNKTYQSHKLKTSKNLNMKFNALLNQNLKLTLDFQNFGTICQHSSFEKTSLVVKIVVLICAASGHHRFIKTQKSCATVVFSLFSLFAFSLFFASDSSCRWLFSFVATYYWTFTFKPKSVE